MVAPWRELSGFPRTFAASVAPAAWQQRVGQPSTVRRGKRATQGTDALQGSEAFALLLERLMVAAYASNPDADRAFRSVIEAHAQHVAEVGWARVRGSDLDADLLFFGDQTRTRLYLSLTGPVGAYADKRPPVRAKGAASAKKSTKRTTPSPAARKQRVAAGVAEGPAGWKAPLHLVPLFPKLAPGSSTSLAFARSGKLHLYVERRERRRPEFLDSVFPDRAPVWLTLSPDGTTEIEAVPTAAQLREGYRGVKDPTAGIGPEECFVRPLAGSDPVRCEIHTSMNERGRERIGVGGVWSVASCTSFESDSFVAAEFPWVLRLGAQLKGAKLYAIHMGTGARKAIPLEGVHDRILPVMIGHRLHVQTSRPSRRGWIDEVRVFDVSFGKTCVVTPVPSATRVLGHNVFEARVPEHEASVIASDGMLEWVSAAGKRTRLVTCPDMIPWERPTVFRGPGRSVAVGARFRSNEDNPAIDNDGQDPEGIAYWIVSVDARGIPQASVVTRIGKTKGKSSAPPARHLDLGETFTHAEAVGPHGELAVVVDRETKNGRSTLELHVL